ncbi:MAG: phosphodiester glycosidase family protein [Deltaproteobacteria bacterium]|nr:phosphodiester glycosidase family protein [Deltaproteobacteria bacterium]
MIVCASCSASHNKTDATAPNPGFHNSANNPIAITRDADKNEVNGSSASADPFSDGASQIVDGISYTKRQYDPDNDAFVNEIDIHLLEIADGVSFDVTRSEDRMQTTSEFAQAYGCIAAVNGGNFWNLENAGDKYCDAKGHVWGGSSRQSEYHKGIEWQPLSRDSHNPINSRYYFATHGGKPFFEMDEDFTVDTDPDAPDLVLGGIWYPVVIDGEQAYSHEFGIKKDMHVNIAAQRTIIAETYHQTVLLIVATSKFGRDQCLTREQMSYYMANVLMDGQEANKGVKNAIELDGGGSSTMYIQDRGVVTPLYDPPSKTSPGGERIVANHIGVGCTRTGRAQKFVSPFKTVLCTPAGE